MRPDQIEKLISDLRPAPGSFLDGMAPEHVGHLLRPGRSVMFDQQDVLIRQADPSAHTIYLLDGWVKVTAASDTGYEVLLAVRGPGDILGELSALDGRPRGGTVAALTPVRAVLVAATAFIDCLATQPPVALSLLRELVGRLRDADAKRLAAAAYPTAQRLAAFLLTLADRYSHTASGDVPHAIPLSQQELAGAVGASRETVAKVLRILRERGVVETSRRQTVIAQPEVLLGLARSVYIDTDGL